jgi:hypothetical protein
MEETRKLKIRQKDEMEKAKLNRHLQKAAVYSRSATGQPDAQHEILVEGIAFRVTHGGSKLVRVSSDADAAKKTPKFATIGGVRFYRSKTGNLIRSGIVKAQRYGPTGLATWIDRVHLRLLTQYNVRASGAIKKIDEPCRLFSTTGTSFLSNDYRLDALFAYLVGLHSD